MRKSLSILLIVLLTLALLVTGCTSNTQAPEKEGESSGEGEGSEEVKKPEGYPSKPIEFIVPAPAGAVIDVPARALVENLDLGKPVVVVNRPGASQTVGMAEAAAKKPDGYTILFGANAGFLLQPHMIDLTYSLDDFRHIAMAMSPDPMAVVVKPDSEIKTFEDLESKLKAGERMTYSFSNPGGIGHLGMLAVLDQMGNESAEFVPFNGSAEGITALLGGHIDFFVVDTSEVVQRVKEKQFTALTILSNERVETLPDTPCAEEFGYKGMESYLGYKWISVLKDTPDEIVQWLKQEIDKGLLSEEFQAYLKNAGSTALRSYTEEEVTDTLQKANDELKKALEGLDMTK